MQLKILNVIDSLSKAESNPTIGEVIPKLNTRIIDTNLISGLFIIEYKA
jgi:hypothetical protein